MQSGKSDEFNVQEGAKFHMYREILSYTVPFCTIKFFCLITPKKKENKEMPLFSSDVRTYPQAFKLYNNVIVKNILFCMN